MVARAHAPVEMRAIARINILCTCVDRFQGSKAQQGALVFSPYPADCPSIVMSTHRLCLSYQSKLRVVIMFIMGSEKPYVLLFFNHVQMTRHSPTETDVVSP